MKAFVIFVALLPLIQSLSLPLNDPLPTDPAKLARWIVHNSSMIQTQSFIQVLVSLKICIRLKFVGFPSQTNF